MINLARHLGIDPEISLMQTNNKFTHRFEYIERQLSRQGKKLKDASLDEMESLWQEAKRDK